MRGEPGEPLTALTPLDFLALRVCLDTRSIPLGKSFGLTTPGDKPVVIHPDSASTCRGWVARTLPGVEIHSILSFIANFTIVGYLPGSRLSAFNRRVPLTWAWGAILPPYL